jgi:hypothetical protein
LQSQSNSNRDSQRSDENYSQSDPDSNSDRHSDTDAIVTRPEYHADAYANSNACGCVGTIILTAPREKSFLHSS